MDLFHYKSGIHECLYAVWLSIAKTTEPNHKCVLEQALKQSDWKWDDL